MPGPKKIFISYNQKDADQALELRRCTFLFAGAYRSCWALEQRELIRPASFVTEPTVIVR